MIQENNMTQISYEESNYEQSQEQSVYQNQQNPLNQRIQNQINEQSQDGSKKKFNIQSESSGSGGSDEIQKSNIQYNESDQLINSQTNVFSQSVLQSQLSEDKVQINPYATSVVNFTELPIENTKKSGIFSSFVPQLSNDNQGNSSQQISSKRDNQINQQNEQQYLDFMDIEETFENNKKQKNAFIENKRLIDYSKYDNIQTDLNLPYDMRQKLLSQHQQNISESKSSVKNQIEKQPNIIKKEIVKQSRIFIQKQKQPQKYSQIILKNNDDYETSQTSKEEWDQSYIQRAYRREQLTEQTFCSLLYTIMTYIISDIQKKQRSFKIGIFTIFLVVSFITALKSLVDVAPIVMLKQAQDNAGSIDISLKSSSPNFVTNGDKSPYEINPFQNGTLQMQNFNDDDTIDHTSIPGFEVLIFKALQNKLDGLSNTGQFWKGFSPRWIIPAKLRNPNKPEYNTTTMIIIIDSAREIQIGIGPHFSQKVIGDSEIIVSKSAINYLFQKQPENAKQVQLYLSFPDSFSSLIENNKGQEEKQIQKDKFIQYVSKRLALNILDHDFNLSLNQIFYNNQIQTEQSLKFQQNDLNQNRTIQQIRLQKMRFLQNIFYNGFKQQKIEQNTNTEQNNNADNQFGNVLKHNFNVIETFELPDGKFSDNLGNVGVIDCNYLHEYFSPSLKESIQKIRSYEPTIDQIYNKLGNTNENLFALPDINFCDYAQSIIGIVDNQVETYSVPFLEMKRQLTLQGNELMKAISLNANVTSDTPIESKLFGVRAILVFMSTIMTTIVAFLGILSVQLIYSLMLSDVEEKTYEFGMLRALGFNTKNIMITIIMQAFTFSIPGLLSGLLTAFFFNYSVRYVLYSVSQNQGDYLLTSQSIIIGVFIGTVLPLISNIIPIQKALGKNLRASLDMYQRSVSEMNVQIKSLEKFGFSISQMILGLALLILGILCYYVAPVSFLYKNNELFFGILNSLLLFMILGLVYLSILILPQVQKVFLYLMIFICWRDFKLRKVVLQNLDSHKGRNIKTSIMFAVSLGFLIYAGSTFMLIGYMIESQVEMTLGADIYGITLDQQSMWSILDDGSINQYLLSQQDQYHDVENWTFVSHSMEAILKKVIIQESLSSYFSDYSGFKSGSANIYSIQQNFFDAVNLKFYIPNEIDSQIKDNLKDLPNGEPDITWGLYNNKGNISPTSDGSKDPKKLVITNNQTQNEKNIQNLTEGIKVLIPEGLRDPLSMSTKVSGRFCIGLETNNCLNSYKVKVRAMVTKMPGIQFTGYQLAQFQNKMLTSEQQFNQILEDIFQKYPGSKENYKQLTSSYNLTNGIPKCKLYIKMSAEASQERRDFIQNGVRSFFRDDITVIFDIRLALKQLNNSLLLFDMFVLLIGIISMIISFFLLLISTSHNIRDNIQEFGCLRAMGLTKNQGMRMFMYEQYSVIFSALFLGLIIGIILAAIVGGQFFMFIELPPKMLIPNSLVIAMILMSIITTFFAVYIPLKEVNKKQIASIVKGLTS